MQWRIAMVVSLIDVGTAVHKLGGHSVLSHVAGHVECCVSKNVGLISLRSRRRKCLMMENETYETS